MSDVVLIRPGCTDFDEQHRIQGSLDLPLSRRGQEQVELVVAQLRGVRLDVVYAAPCEPARSTAIAICNASGAAFKELTEFCNLNHGLWQGLQLDDARRKYPRVFKQWQESPETVCLPEGETVAEVVERIERGLRKCLKKKRNVGIVASEPLATLIGCVLRGCRPEFPCATASCEPERRIEFLHLSEDEGAGRRSVIASASAIGHDMHPEEANRDVAGRDVTGRNGQKSTNGSAVGETKPIGHNGAAGKNGSSTPRDEATVHGGPPENNGSAEMPVTAPRRAPE